jgi:DNA-3-methyladenine glycosylase I
MEGRPDPRRCGWASLDDARYLAYHDEEWGLPSRDERHLFEMLVLEGAQAGLSWSTILNKRAGYRRAFADFDVAAVARFGADDVARLLADTGIVRNRAKVASAITNAQATLDVQRRHGGLGRYLWSFVGDRPIVNRWRTVGDVPAETELSRRMSRDLRSLGFTFVGPTVCYAFMQAVGLVNDHTIDCYRWQEVQAAR